MNYFSSGNTSALSSVLLTSSKTHAGPKPSEARDSGAEFHTAMQDVARTKNTARPEPVARQRQAERAESHPAPAGNRETDAAHVEGNTPVDKTTKPGEKQPADEAVEPTVASSSGETGNDALKETGAETSVLLAEAGLVGPTETTEITPDKTSLLAPNAEAAPEDAELETALLITPLAPEVSGATPLETAADGITLPPVAGIPATTPEAAARLRNLVSDSSKTANLSLAIDEPTDGLKAAVAEIPEGENGLLELDGELSLEDFKLPFSRLLAANGVTGKEAQMTEQSLTKLVSAASPQMIDAASRPAETQAPSQRGFVVQTGVPMTLGQPRWGQAVGERVLWLAAQNVSSAELRLDPPELGPMQVRVSIQHDQASVSFSSPHPMVREALDQSATRLREMFSEQGLNLTNMDVSDQSFARQNARDEASSGGGGNGSDADIDDEEAPVGITTDIARLRLVDHYA